MARPCMTEEEIAKALNITQSGVCRIIRRALKKLATDPGAKALLEEIKFKAHERDRERNISISCHISEG